jgi:hypothetical protein
LRKNLPRKRLKERKLGKKERLIFSLHPPLGVFWPIFNIGSWFADFNKLYHISLYTKNQVLTRVAG